MVKLLWWLCVATAGVSNGAMYSSKDAVVNLNPSNFKSKVLQSPGVWMVEFYAVRKIESFNVYF